MVAPIQPDPPVINPTPKARFMQSGTRISNHRQMVSGSIFETSADSALLEYQRVVTESIRDNNTALAAAFKMEGALEFLHVFKMLAESPWQRAPAPQSNLNPNV